VLDSLLCHDLLHDSTYISLVGVDNPLHNVLVVRSCGTLLVLYLVQILLYLILHLYIHLNLCVVYCAEVPDYTEVYLVLSSFLHVPYKYLKLFLSSNPSFYNPYHHDPLIWKKINMNFLVLSYISASLDNDMDHSHVSYKSCTIVLLLVMGLVPLSPYTVRKLEIHSYGVLMSYIGYTK
jgi:hypothetical protein